MTSLRSSGVFTLWMKILGRMDFLGGKGFCSFINQTLQRLWKSISCKPTQHMRWLCFCLFHLDFIWMLRVLSSLVDLDAVHNDITNWNHCACPCLCALMFFVVNFHYFVHALTPTFTFISIIPIHNSTLKVIRKDIRIRMPYQLIPRLGIP
jgi:hypothetical protein